jgi:PAS domain S-box-containing protein
MEMGLDITKRKRAETALQNMHDMLEIRVEKRTAELKQTNAELQLEIEKRKETEETLRQTRDYLEKLFNYANAPIICWDTELRITRFNHAFELLSGYMAPEVLGKKLSMLFPANSKEDSLDNIRRTLTEHWKVVEIPILRKDGAVKIALWNSANVFAEDGKTILATIAQGEDITERKKAEEALKLSNENLEQFAYVASHDLQEPLRIMASYSALLEKRYKNKLDSDADEFIVYIVEAANRMQALIRDLLAHSRAGRSDTSVASTDCNTVLGKVIYNLSGIIKESGAVITNDVLPAAMCNESDFVHLFQNLIGNAIKFRGPESPRIHLGAKKEGGKWLFSFRDNGIGIEEKYKERIFSMFERLHGKDKYPGTGMGLAICKKIVTRYNGRIWVESKPGNGSTFYFIIPANLERKA